MRQNHATPKMQMQQRSTPTQTWLRHLHRHRHRHLYRSSWALQPLRRRQNDRHTQTRLSTTHSATFGRWCCCLRIDQGAGDLGAGVLALQTAHAHSQISFLKKTSGDPKNNSSGVWQTVTPKINKFLPHHFHSYHPPKFLPAFFFVLQK